MATDRGLIPGNSTADQIDFEEALSFALCQLENKDFTLKAQQKEAVKHVWDGKDVFVLLPLALANLLSMKCYLSCSITSWEECTGKLKV